VTGSSVRAAVMVAPGSLRVTSFPMPEPGPGAALLRVHYAGICGTDRHTWRGESLQYAGTAHERQAAYPLVCGHENVGVIAALGPGEPPTDETGRPLRVGDRVVPAPNLTCGRCRYCLDGHPYYLCTGLHDYGNSLSSARPPHLFGGWAEHMYLLPGTRLFRVPDELPAELAALTELLAVTNGLDTARLLAGSGGGFTFGASVAVLGAGPLGLMHLAKAELLGAGRLLAVDPLPARLEHARGFGAEVSLDAGALDRGERLAALREATGGLGPDLVVSCSGTPETFAEAVDAVRPGGTVIEAGAFCGARTVPVDPNLVCVKGIAVLGVGGEVLQQYAPALRMLARHGDRLPFARMITHRIALEQVAAMLDEGPAGGAVKVLVAPNGHRDR
jgi:threonine dehydrogenase-like Zn-dependent dehydrogenase